MLNQTRDLYVAKLEVGEPVCCMDCGVSIPLEQVSDLCSLCDEINAVEVLTEMAELAAR